MTFLLAFAVGFVGSVHCIGMCGGIVGLLSPDSTDKKWTDGLSYNLGRLFSYTVAGVIVGALGHAATNLFPFKTAAGIGLMLSGFFMIILGLSIANWWHGLSRVEQIGALLWRKLQAISKPIAPSRKISAQVLRGMVWGWLPCGLVYSTLVWAMTTGSAMSGALVMLCFGLGTLPTLLTMGHMAQRLKTVRENPRLRQSIGVLLILLGALTFFGVVTPYHVTLIQPEGTTHQHMH